MKCRHGSVQRSHPKTKTVDVRRWEARALENRRGARWRGAVEF